MVRKKNALPEIGEIVMATVVEVNPSHVYMILDDYKGTGKDGINREGFNINESIRDNAIAYMHVSEIANYWIKNIREHIKEGQKHVVKVLKNFDDMLLAFLDVLSNILDPVISNLAHVHVGNRVVPDRF